MSLTNSKDSPKKAQETQGRAGDPKTRAFSLFTPCSPANALHSRRVPPLIKAVGILLWLGMAILFCVKSAATTDEIAYLGAGLSYLEFNDFRMNPEHPPLVKYVCALPVFLFDKPDMSNRVRGTLAVAREDSPWLNNIQGAYQAYLLFVADYKPVALRLLLGRLPMVGIALLGGLIAGMMAQAIGGTPRAGTLAAFFLLFYPEYLGHGCLMTMDVPLTVVCGAQAVSAWAWWRRTTKRNTMLFVVVAAVGSLVKLPSVVFTIFLVLALAGLSFASGKRVRFRRVATLALFTLAAGIFAAWMGAGFRFAAVPPGAEIDARNPRMPPIQLEHPSVLVRSANALWKWRVLPETTLTTLANFHKFERRPYVFMGAVSTRGWYSYFFVTFLLKTTPALLLGVLALAFWGGLRFRRRRRSIAGSWRVQRDVLLLVPFLFLFVVTVLARVNQGHRYILFLYLPLCAYLGVASDRWFRSTRLWSSLAALLVAGQLLSALLTYPHFSTYFNFLTGSPYKGVRYVADSNTDIGQDVLLLSSTLSRLGYDSVNLALYGLNLPDAYGIRNYRWLSIITPPPYVPDKRLVTAPDPRLPTALSVNVLRDVRRAYPGLFDHDPDIYLNGIVLYLPEN